MKVAFRVDASLPIGSGHVMRCLTLADALKDTGAHCMFICRENYGDMVETIKRRGFYVVCLPTGSPSHETQLHETGQASQDLAHADWLGCSWKVDAEQTCNALAAFEPDWLVVDHYALDERWEATVRPYFNRLLAIDDLADRAHVCDILLDQNLGRQAADYTQRVPPSCRLLIGPQHSLLRPEFAALRGTSLLRRTSPQLRHLLVTMGGMDLPDASGRVLRALQSCSLPADCRVTVVMGAKAPHLEHVLLEARAMQWPTEVLVNVTDMAQRMADSDLAIGAAGGTAWERCCLGLPTLVITLAENQLPGAHALQSKGAANLIGNVDAIGIYLPRKIAQMNDPGELKRMSDLAGSVTDGLGVGRVLKAMGAGHG